MVSAGHDQHIEPLHPLVAGNDVVDGVIKGMPHVQRARDIGRRDGDAKLRARVVHFGVKEAALLPKAIPALFQLSWVVSGRESEFPHGKPSFKPYRCPCNFGAT
jgi:hypothetical protein